MAPRDTHQVTPEGAIDVQEIVAHADLIAWSRAPQQVRGECRSETCNTKVCGCGLHVLDAQAAVVSPFNFVAEAERGAESPVVEKIFRRTKISAYQLRPRAARQEVSIVIESHVAHAVREAQIRLVGADHFPEIEIDPIPPV